MQARWDEDELRDIPAIARWLDDDQLLDDESDTATEDSDASDTAAAGLDATEVDTATTEETTAGALDCPYCDKEFTDYQTRLQAVNALDSHVRQTGDTDHGGAGIPGDWEEKLHDIRLSNSRPNDATADRSTSIRGRLGAVLNRLGISLG